MKVWNRLGWSAILLAHAFQAYVAYLLFFPVQPFRVTGQPKIIYRNITPQAASIAYLMDYCQTTDGPSTIAREFVKRDGTGVQWIGQLPVASGELDKGCHSVVVNMDVPDSLPNGQYVLQISRTFNVNPLRTYSTSFRTEPFTVNR